MTFRAAPPIWAMMAALIVPFRLFRRLIAPLLLVMICVHALTPLNPPSGRVSGSAFSAQTADVSLRAGHRSAVIKQAEVPRPPVPLPEPVGIVPVAAFAALLPASVPGLGPTGPPPATTSFRPLSPRAPPAA